MDLKMKKTEYWEKVDKKFNNLKSDFDARYERSTDTELIHETVLDEIRQLWKFTDYCIGNNSKGYPIYSGGRLSYVKDELDKGNRDYNDEDQLELDAYLKFEKWLCGDELGVENYHLGNSLKKEIRSISDADKLKRYLIANNIDKFFKEIQAIFADLPYNINKSKEGYFHSHLHLLLRMLGFKITSEVSTNIGRIDSVIELKNKIYIIEFKIGTTEAAIKQIAKNKYFQKYQGTSKKIVLIGVSCSEKERNILAWEYEELEK
jgi:hypothetical protein